MKKKIISTAVGLMLSAACLVSNANASIIVLDFEGAGDNATLNDFYNGGTDSAGNSGTNYGITFSSNSLGLIDADAGGSGNFANEPTASTAMYFTTGTGAILNYAAGFDTGFSFFYTSSGPASVNVFDDVDGAGTLLGTIDLIGQHTLNCAGDPGGTFCNWSNVGVSFAGIAKSIDFGGTQNQVAFDDITFGSATAGQIPEPSILAFLGLGLLGLASRRLKRI